MTNPAETSDGSDSWTGAERHIETQIYSGGIWIRGYFFFYPPKLCVDTSVN